MTLRRFHKHGFRPVGVATFRVYVTSSGIDRPAMILACRCGDWRYMELWRDDWRRILNVT